MTTHELDEVAALTAEVRAMLEHLLARGETEVPTAEASPPASTVEASAPVSAPVSPPAASDLVAWSRLANKARAGGDPSERLAQVVAELGDCRRCALCSDRTRLVFGSGNPRADLVIVGEAPGFQEDQSGEPFVGPAGEMLDKMLQHVLGRARSEVYIVNVVKCRPPNNRDPAPAEIAACRPFLEQQIDAIRPKVILALGSVAWKALSGQTVGIQRARGNWSTYQGIPLMPTFHPAYLLRVPEEKRHTFADLKAVRARLEADGPPEGAVSGTGPATS